MFFYFSFGLFFFFNSFWNLYVKFYIFFRWERNLKNSPIVSNQRGSKSLLFSLGTKIIRIWNNCFIESYENNPVIKVQILPYTYFHFLRMSDFHFFTYSTSNSSTSISCNIRLSEMKYGQYFLLVFLSFCSFYFNS